MTGACSEAEDDSGDTALRPEGGGVAKSTWKFMLPLLPVHYISRVEDLLDVPAGDMYVQPPRSFAAIDSIAILGGTAYLVQITEDVERNITVGLLSVLACLPSHLEVRFVWALPAHVWEKHTFNRKPIPQIASLSYPSPQGRAHSKEHVQTAEKSTLATAESAKDGTAAEANVFGVGRQAIKELVDRDVTLVEERMAACETQFKMSIPPYVACRAQFRAHLHGRLGASQLSSSASSPARGTASAVWPSRIVRSPP